MKRKTDLLEKFSPHLDAVNEKIKRRLDRFFRPGGHLKKKCSEWVKCYNCGSDSVSSEFYVDRFRHVRCKRCAMVYVNPRLKTDIIESTYSEEEYSTFQYRMKIIPAVEFRRNVLGVRKYQQIQRYFKGPGKVLDIGCGIGEVLSVFKENGWSCQGIEFNELAATYAREKFGLNVLQESIYNLKSTVKYDCIMMWGILEHVTEPKRLLKQIKNYLTPEGLLLIQVPSADSLLVKFIEAKGRMNNLSPKRILIPDRHLMFFSHTSLNQMVKSCGFRIVSLLTNGLDISTLFRLLSIDTKDEDSILALQEAVDNCSCGDLTRAFCRHKER